MVFQVELAKCRWTMQGIDMAHLWPAPGMAVSEGPLLVSLMNDGNHFVHDGRHRAIRALLRGETLHDAEWLEDHAAEEIEILDRIVHGLPTESKSIVLHVNGERAYPSFGETKKGNDHDLQAIEKPRHTENSPRAACGKYHSHEPHDMAEITSRFCNGQVMR